VVGFCVILVATQNKKYFSDYRLKRLVLKGKAHCNLFWENARNDWKTGAR